MVTAQVLVVEDEKIVAKAIENELTGLGYYVSAVASSGEEALKKVAETNPDVVLMDIVLKGDMDGIKAAEQVRERFDIPVVYLTAYEDDDTLGRAKKTEPFGYLLKPYEEKELHTTIEMALYKHRMERRLKESRQWLAATLRSIDDAVIATDGRQQVQFMNPVAEILTGWKKEDALGCALSDVCCIVDEQTRAQVDNAPARALHGGGGVELAYDSLLVGRYGIETPVEGNVAPIFDDEGNFTGLVLTMRDITERREMDKLRRQSEEHLRHSQKMEAVGRLAGGVAHDFNNLLTAILGNTSLLMASVSRDDPNIDLLTRIEAASLRAAALVKQLLGFSGRRSLWLEATDLNQLIDETVNGYRTSFDIRTRIEFEPGRGLWPVRGDRAQLAEGLMSLCLNAQDAMPSGGILRIETENVVVGEDYLRRRLEAHPGDYVRLRVTDTGTGIAPEIQARIFEPFFTTKEPGKGTGLGLALLHGIVEEHRGWVECRSEVGRGATFDVYLPRYWQEAVLPETPERAKVVRGVAETILLADDERLIRELGRTILERCGYSVLLAEDGVEAVEVFQREKHRIDLVLLDLTMPRLSGDDAFRQMAEIDPGVRAVFSSGYFAEDVTGEDPRILGFIPKPYRYEDLIKRVREALDVAKDSRTRN